MDPTSYIFFPFSNYPWIVAGTIVVVRVASTNRVLTGTVGFSTTRGGVLVVSGDSSVTAMIDDEGKPHVSWGWIRASAGTAAVDAFCAAVALT